MEIKKAEIKDLNIVVKLKMDMFKEVGSIALLQDNAEEQIYETYKELYQEEKGCHYLVYENDSVIACGGAVIKEDVPFCFFKTPMYGYIIDVYCIPEKRRNGYYDGRYSVRRERNNQYSAYCNRGIIIAVIPFQRISLSKKKVIM